MSAVNELRVANKNHYDRMLPFDDIEIGRLVARTGNGIIQADDVYTKALINGSKDDLENIFKGLRDYDDYIKLDFPLISKNNLFYDVIYNPRETNFLKTGKSLGSTTLNGKLMFIYQAHSAFNIWHGIEPHVNEYVIKLLD